MNEVSLRRKKRLREIIWPFFRFFILFGLGFVILYPLIYMLSCAFRESSDMTDPTVMWITRHYTLDIIRETINAMDFGNTLLNTLKLNIGCSVVQVISCAITGYGFARFKFRGKSIMFGIVIMMILVPAQIISLPLYTQFRYFGIKGIFSINLIDSMACMYLPAATGNGIRSGLMILIFRQFFRGMPKELEDAAYLDGCGPFGTFLRVMMPNALSSLLTVFLFSVVFYWNDYYVSSTSFTNNKYEIKPMARKSCPGIGITSVILPEGLENIEYTAFEGNNLKTVTIPSTVTKIDNYAFMNNQLQSVIFKGDKSKIDIKCESFKGKKHSNSVNAIEDTYCK